MGFSFTEQASCGKASILLAYNVESLSRGIADSFEIYANAHSHCRGHRFESGMLHSKSCISMQDFLFNPRFCKVTLRKLQVCKRCKRFDHNSKENIHLFHDIALRFHRRVRIVLRSTPFLMRRTADKPGNFPFHNNEEGNKHLVSN